MRKKTLIKLLKETEKNLKDEQTRNEYLEKDLIVLLKDNKELRNNHNLIKELINCNVYNNAELRLRKIKELTM